jgi:hypothetical protein
MKWKPVLCVAVLALAAGCAQQNPYASFGEYGFSYDLEQAPVPGLTIAENERIARTPTGSPTQLLNAPIIIPSQMQQPTPNQDFQQAPPGAEVTPGAKPDAGAAVSPPVETPAATTPMAPVTPPAETPTAAPSAAPAAPAPAPANPQ